MTRQSPTPTIADRCRAMADEIQRLIDCKMVLEDPLCGTPGPLAQSVDVLRLLAAHRDAEGLKP